METTVRVVVKGKIVGRIIEDLPIPGATHNRLAIVDVGDGTPRRIMWGGLPHLRAGDLVAVALPGARLDNGAKVRRRHWNYDTRIDSDGILLSRHEAGWPPINDELHHDRVMVLKSGIPGDCLDQS